MHTRAGEWWIDDMQAAERNAASNFDWAQDHCEGSSGKFAALREVTRRMKFQGAGNTRAKRSLPSDRKPSCEIASGIAEGAGLAHDAGNLLGALSLYSDLLAMPGVLHEEHREYAAELRMLSDRSWAMINRLVNHARGAGRGSEATESAVLPDVLDRCRGLLSRVAGMRVEISYGVGAFQPVLVAVESVERIVTNLVKNAAEATPWVGAIAIHVEGILEPQQNKTAPRRRVVLTVSDRGCGMEAAAIRRLMDGDGVSVVERRGIGFRVVRELVAISGGSLQIDSQVDVGTTISMEWYGIDDAEAGVIARNQAQMRQVVRGEAGWIAY